MTHPAPTTRPQAPPLPLRGEGMGVGGQRLIPRPRPGPEPGPRFPTSASPTQKVPGQARDGVAFALALLLATPAAAQIIPTGTPAADILLSQAITEQRLFHTCSALDPQTHGFLTEAWTEDAAAAAAILADNNVPSEVIAAFTAAAATEALLPAPDIPFESVRQLCGADPDWIGRVNRLDFIRLATDLPKAFE